MPGRHNKRRGPRSAHGPIGESARISFGIQLEKFIKDDSETELKFPSCLSVQDREHIHKKVLKMGLNSKSRGAGVHRYITVYKRSGSTLVQKDARLVLDPHMRQSIAELLEMYPITSREKEDLNSERERSQTGHKNIGYLNTTIPQIPNTQINPEVAAFKKSLPVYLHNDQIINTINLNQAVVIVGETGSGKTTQIPQLILDQCQKEKRVCRIICTQPRRISAVSVAERVAYERNEKVGQSIGYQIRLESRVSPKTVLTYCTNGVLLRTLMGGGSALASTTHVIVDEVHERDKLGDFILISLKEALTKFKDLRVVLMSATIDAGIFSRYFNNCPIISIPGRLFEVEKIFLEDILATLNYKSDAMKSGEKSFNKKKKQPSIAALALTETAPVAETPKDEQTDTTTYSLNADLQADVDDFLSDCFTEGSLDSFGQILYMYVSEGVPIDCCHSESGMTGLMAAAHHGLTETVEQIIKMGGDPAVVDNAGKNAFVYATANKQIECANFLQHMICEEKSSSALEEVNAEMPEDNLQVQLYMTTTSDDVIDHTLMLAIVKYIHLTQGKGGILIFLPGYDDIVRLRDAVEFDPDMLQAKFQLFTLHSNMQTLDQKKVFHQSPGIRKIIIATNIAETSITIDDVVYVIDSGKVKEMYYESSGGVSSLQVDWVSKACAAQRAGRAGRTRPGKAYLLYSRRRFESFLDNSIPEILRVPLHELCLHTKLLAPGNATIADFLSKALEPPSFLAIRNSVNLLKTIGALTPTEDLTEIGQHLLDLTIEPKLGKMLLYACVLKCLDPVLTIACSLAYKEPFQINPDPENRRSGGRAKREFAADSFSDHMALLRAFQAWQAARAAGSERKFCRTNLISGAAMEMVVGLRSQLLAQLRAIGLVKSRGPGDIKDANVNSEKWHVVKAVLVSGLYPSVARVDREHATLRTSAEVRLALHPSSTLHVSGGKAGLMKSLSALPSDWLVYEETTRIGRFRFIRCNTAVTALTVVLFGGPLRLSPDALRAAVPGLSDDSDSEADSDELPESSAPVSCLALDDWVVFTADSRDALSVYLFRQKFAALMIRRMLHPAKLAGPADDRVISVLVQILGAEERKIGLSQPMGIGQRPRQLMMDVHNVRPRSEYDDQPGGFDSRSPRRPGYSNDNFNSRGSYSGSVPALSKPVKPQQSRQDVDNRPRPGFSGAAPDSNILLANIEKYTMANGSVEDSPVIRYFVIRAQNSKVIEGCQFTRKWNFILSTEKKLVKAIQSGHRALLFFSIGGNISKFFGCAEFTDEVCERELPTTHKLKWLSVNQIPHHVTRHLMNGLCENRRISSAKDGVEICEESGKALLTLLEQQVRKNRNNGRPIQKQHN